MSRRRLKGRRLKGSLPIVTQGTRGVRGKNCDLGKEHTVVRTRKRSNGGDVFAPRQNSSRGLFSETHLQTSRSPAAKEGGGQARFARPVGADGKRERLEEGGNPRLQGLVDAGSSLVVAETTRYKL